MAVTRLEAARAEVGAAVAALDDEKRAELDRALDITWAEHAAYQDAQARAHASGRIDSALAMFLYRALGEGGSAANGGWPSGTTLAEKVIVTRAIGELLTAERVLAR